jgi:hypothetical protein
MAPKPVPRIGDLVVYFLRLGTFGFGGPVALCGLMEKELVHVHFSDSNRLLPGEGRVDWFGLMQTLQECEFDGYVTMELGLDSRVADPDQIARTALKFLKDVESQLNSKDKDEVNSLPNLLGIKTR